MNIKEKDVFRFAAELAKVDWSHQNLVFLDEVSFDNRGMIRKRGYSLRGTTLAVRGYCPFFNPIEYMFGIVKRAFQRHCVESSERDLMPFVVHTFRRFEMFDMSRVFGHCGWMIQGTFNPVGNSQRKSKQHLTDPSY
ncbi:hypothetical protein JG688_00003082 [Phytophthora aleatoria]|uniref:Tc1-like transposase DDE domain-containing protein n=1 Tax=Phytophthora aleatoria TaxID=2496075 RepID=A0A8J5J3F5_9STRA|nr:hypothetical protein JG688_00003082 [Phytophthora aleatoria]